jgi:ribosomal protein S18 acetylase RimI-like enzyme
MKIRRATDDDAGAFAGGMKSVHDEGLLGPKEDATVAQIKEQFKAGVSDSEFIYLVATLEDELIGAIGLYLDPVLGEYSFGLWLLPGRRGEGSGRALLEAGLKKVPDDVTEMLIEVWPDNDVAIELFEDFGFKPEGLSTEEYPRVDGTKGPVLLMRLLRDEPGPEVNEEA